MRKLSYHSLHGIFRDAMTSKRSEDVVTVRPLQRGTSVFRFHRTRLYELRGRVAYFLSQVNDAMKQSAALPPLRWVMARYNWLGECWTDDLRDVDMLLAMGRALGMVKIILPEDEAAVCDTPFLLILDSDASRRERLLPLAERNIRLSLWRYDFIRQGVAKRKENNSDNSLKNKKKKS